MRFAQQLSTGKKIQQLFETLHPNTSSFGIMFHFRKVIGTWKSAIGQFRFGHEPANRIRFNCLCEALEDVLDFPMVDRGISLADLKEPEAFAYIHIVESMTSENRAHEDFLKLNVNAFDRLFPLYETIIRAFETDISNMLKFYRIADVTRQCQTKKEPLHFGKGMTVEAATELLMSRLLARD